MSRQQQRQHDALIRAQQQVLAQGERVVTPAAVFGDLADDPAAHRTGRHLAHREGEPAGRGLALVTSAVPAYA